MDFRLSNAASEAALYVRTAKDSFPTDNGYQIRLGDGNPSWPAGSVVPRFKAEAVHPEAGEWHALELDAEGDHLMVLIDQKTMADAKDPSAHAGYIGFKVGAGATLEVRNLKLKLIDTVALFNGTDLGGWKTVTPAPKPPKNNPLKKFIPFAAGSKPSVKESVWSVRSGTIHGEKGPGQLETVATYDDFVLQFSIPPLKEKQQGHPAIYVRGDAGKVFTGYEIAMDADRPGAIIPNLAAPRRIVSIKDLAIATVAATGRYLEVWINGFPVTEFTDTRPEGTSTALNARTSAGAIGLPLHDSHATEDYTQVRLTTVAKTVGGSIGKPPPPASTPTAATVATGAAPASAAKVPATGMSPEARQQDANRKQEAGLMQEALSTKDPQQQKEIYGRIVALDPTNAAAVQGAKEAQEKLDRQAAEAQKRETQQTEQQQNESASGEALHRAQLAFFAGNLTAADSQLALADRLAPNNPAVRELRQKLDAARAQSSRLRYLFLGGGLLAFGGLFTLFFIRLRRKQGFLEVISGMDKGRRYDLDHDVIRIGAVAQGDGAKNDIIVRDVEHMVSRFHCEIHQNNGKFYLVDCDSANGTEIDKRLIPPGEPNRLKSGARVDLAGTVTLRFGMERRRKGQARPLRRTG